MAEDFSFAAKGVSSCLVFYSGHKGMIIKPCILEAESVAAFPQTVATESKCQAFSERDYL